MGRIIHDAIVVTSGFKEHAAAARKFAMGLKLQVTNIVGSHHNGYYSFLIIPDGSEEGWEESNRCEKARETWIEWAHGTGAESKPSDVYLNYAHIRFGGDDPECAFLVAHDGEFHMGK